MEFDKWTKEVARTFVSVINRPRFKARLVSEEVSEKHWMPSYVVVFSHGDQEFKLTFTPYRDYVSVYASSSNHTTSRFQFSQKIPRKNPPGLRKIALILMKKVAHKPVFDIMNV